MSNLTTLLTVLVVSPREQDITRHCVNGSTVHQDCLRLLGLTTKKRQKPELITTKLGARLNAISTVSPKGADLALVPYSEYKPTGHQFTEKIVLINEEAPGAYRGIALGHETLRIMDEFIFREPDEIDYSDYDFNDDEFDFTEEGPS